MVSPFFISGLLNHHYDSQVYDDYLHRIIVSGCWFTSGLLAVTSYDDSCEIYDDSPNNHHNPLDVKPAKFDVLMSFFD